MHSHLVTVRRRIIPRLRGVLAGTAIVALATTLNAPVGALAVPPFVFTTYIGGSCVSGTGPPNSAITLSLISRDGVLADRHVVNSNGGGLLLDVDVLQPVRRTA
jgi:hypothetical protein